MILSSGLRQNTWVSESPTLYRSSLRTPALQHSWYQMDMTNDLLHVSGIAKQED